VVFGSEFGILRTKMGQKKPMSGQREADITNVQPFKELWRLEPKMTGQNGHNFSHLCPHHGDNPSRNSISEVQNMPDNLGITV
jgi:hypothetical protein